MFKTVLIVLLIVVAIPLIVAATRPNTLKVQRTATIKARPEKIFPMLDDFRNWTTWSPWEKLDPTMTRKYSGSSSGEGAVYEWEGNKKVGKGRMAITETVPLASVAIDLHFIQPWESRNTTLFTLDPQGDSTTITWTMEGPATFMTKLMGVLMNMDKMIGKDFESGLANMKAAAEN
jgi:hypothetical protein